MFWHGYPLPYARIWVTNYLVGACHEEKCDACKSTLASINYMYV